jgi:cytochrome c
MKENFKIIGAGFAAAVLLAIFAVIFADLFYQPKEAIKRGYEIKLTADGKAAPKEEKKPVNFEELMKLADVTRGEKIFKKCATCHTVKQGEAAKVGPNLFGIIGRAKGSFAGFKYSDAMKAKGGSWNRAEIDQFITKPKDYLPGTKMAFAGLKKPQDRADVILFLEKNR